MYFNVISDMTKTHYRKNPYSAVATNERRARKWKRSPHFPTFNYFSGVKSKKSANRLNHEFTRNDWKALSYENVKKYELVHR